LQRAVRRKGGARGGQKRLLQNLRRCLAMTKIPKVPFRACAEFIEAGFRGRLCGSSPPCFVILSGVEEQKQGEGGTKRGVIINNR
jgi:hypothetical protein